MTMLRSIDSFHSATKLLEFGLLNDLKVNSVYMQCVRWRRKPRWVPVAKSKIFRIPEKPPKNEKEQVEIKRLHDRYKTYMHAVRHYLGQEYLKTISNLVAIQETKTEDEDLMQCMKENEEWNRQVVILREKRLEKEQQARQETILKNLAAFEKRQREHLEKIEHLVREEKERAKFYITPENIDKAIEDALATTVDHNYAIDLKGNMYRGRRSKPEEISPDELEKLKVSSQA